MKEKTELEKFLDRSLFLELRKIKRGVHNDPHNCMIKAKTGDDVLAFVNKLQKNGKEAILRFSKWTLTEEMVGSTQYGKMSFAAYIKESFQGVK